MSKDQTTMRPKRYHPKQKRCDICSDKNNPIYHHHFSSLLTKGGNSTITDTYRQNHQTPVDQKKELTEQLPNITKRLILTSSTLYGVWYHPMPPNTPHFDIESIVGGKIRDMTKVLSRNYLTSPNRLEIVVVAGINNIGSGETAEEIMIEAENLRQKLRAHSLEWQHCPPSYVSFCTVIVPPKFCSLNIPLYITDPDVAKWRPDGNFRNRYGEVKKLNKMIMESNMREGLNYVRLDRIGTMYNHLGKLQHIRDTHPGSRRIWKENEVFRKLHFTMQKKMEIIKHIPDCFNKNN